MTSVLSSKPWLYRIISVLCIGIVLFTGQIAAAGLFCRSDPVVILSNGVIMDFGANISTLPWNVEEVHYELHVPVGVKLIASVHTPTWIASYETFTFHADQPAGEYIVQAIVRTNKENVQVNLDATLVYANLANLSNLRLGLHSAPGFQDQLLTILLNL